jgi:peptidoglycan-associated lipoprotein
VIPVEELTDFGWGSSVISGEFDLLVSDLRDPGEGAGHIGLHEVANTVELEANAVDLSLGSEDWSRGERVFGHRSKGGDSDGCKKIAACLRHGTGRSGLAPSMECGVAVRNKAQRIRDRIRISPHSGQYPLSVVLRENLSETGTMRYRIFAPLSFLAAGALLSACSHTKPATAPTTASASSESADAAARESARIREEADRAAATARADADRAAKARADAMATLTTPVRFEFDRSELNDQALQQLDAKVAVLQANPAIRVRIEGNADDSGSDEYNMALSQRRAAMVQRYFTDRGIDAGRLQIVSFGEEHPSCTTDREEPCRAQNRRDEFVVISGL